MTAQPTPTAVHPDFTRSTGMLRDAPASDFFAMMEQAGATPEFLTSLRADW